MGAATLAYLDAGTGSMLLQVVLGGVAAVGVAVKLFWRRLRDFFRHSKDEEPAPPAAG